MKIKLLAVDLDGTLLNKDGKISEANKAALRLAEEKGIKVVISTGRSTPTMSCFREELGLLSDSDYAITLNGGCVLRASIVIKEHRLARADALAIIKEIRELPSVRDSIRVYLSADISAIEREDEYTNFYHNYTGLGALVVPKLEDEILGDVFKVLILQEIETVQRASKALADKLPASVNMFFSSAQLLEFTAKNATKGNALAYLSGELGLQKDEIAAMGDNFNDISMLKFAGLPIAPQNAEPSVKSIAKIVTRSTNNESAVAEAVNAILSHQ